MSDEKVVKMIKYKGIFSRHFHNFFTTFGASSVSTYYYLFCISFMNMFNIKREVLYLLKIANVEKRL